MYAGRLPRPAIRAASGGLNLSRWPSSERSRLRGTLPAHEPRRNLCAKKTCCGSRSRESHARTALAVPAISSRVDCRLLVEGHERSAPGTDGVRVRHTKITREFVISVAQDAPV